MSYFGNYTKDEIVESIKKYAEENKEMSLADLYESIMQAVNYGMTSVMYDKEEQLKKGE